MYHFKVVVSGAETGKSTTDIGTENLVEITRYSSISHMQISICTNNQCCIRPHCVTCGSERHVASDTIIHIRGQSTCGSGIGVYYGSAGGNRSCGGKSGHTSTIGHYVSSCGILCTSSQQRTGTLARIRYGQITVSA